jgi:hypothetical protein
VHFGGRDRLDSESSSQPASIGDDELSTSDHFAIDDSLLDYTTTKITFTMADSNSNAPITAAAVRPNRPMSEALLNEKVGIAHGDLQEKEHRRCEYIWTRPKNNG